MSVEPLQGRRSDRNVYIMSYTVTQLLTDPLGPSLNIDLLSNAHITRLTVQSKRKSLQTFRGAK